MDDLISRQAAISEILDDLKDTSLHDDPDTPEDYAEGFDEGIRNAAAIVLQMPSAQQWIPVTERLPEDVNIGEEYPTVIFCTKDAVYAGFFEHYLGGNWWAAEDYTVDNVIAWMPLPSPWKGERR